MEEKGREDGEAEEGKEGKGEREREAERNRNEVPYPHLAHPNPASRILSSVPALTSLGNGL